MEEKLEIANGTNFFDGEMNRSVYSEKDICDYVRSTHKAGDIEQLFKVPQEIYDSECRGRSHFSKDIEILDNLVYLVVLFLTSFSFS